jgi:hypothetical protein
VTDQDGHGQVFMMLSAAAVSGSALLAGSMQFRGSLGGCELFILVDSGSSHSFLSTSIAASLPNIHKLSAHVYSSG